MKQFGTKGLSIELLGEGIGTFILVFIGCGAVATSVLFSSHSGLFQIAILWGIGVMLAIYISRHLSCAHFNPAVSIAMVIAGRMRLRKLPFYLLGQFMGAFMAAVVLYTLFSESISSFEILNHIERGSEGSKITAMIFGDYYSNVSVSNQASIGMYTAFKAELVGTFLFVFFIFSLTEGCNVGRPDDSFTPVFIGLSVTSIIAVIAPLTQAGLNPARDLAPRLLAYLAGWKNAAFAGSLLDSVVVYVIGPIVGGILAAFIFKYLLKPIMKKKKSCC